MPAHDEHRDPSRDNPAEPGPGTPEPEEPTTHDRPDGAPAHEGHGTDGSGDRGPERGSGEAGGPGDGGPERGSGEAGGPGDGGPGRGSGEGGGPEHDGRDGDGFAPGGMDALMAVLLDEPLSARARQDPGVVAAHRAAVVDVAVLREQLTLIGDALAAEAADGEGAGAPAGRREAGRLAGGPGA
ncbi:hypothetical protein B7767_19170, partial [Streptomyces sp. 13-12-16]